MRNGTKKKFISILSVATVAFAAAAVSNATAIGLNSVSAETNSAFFVSNASVRFRQEGEDASTSTAGIRFETLIEKDVYDGLEGVEAVVTRIVPKDMLTGTLTYDNEDPDIVDADMLNKQFTEEIDGVLYYSFKTYIYQIPASSYYRDITVMSYIYDGNDYYTTEPFTRSISEVANLAYNDLKAESEFSDGDELIYVNEVDGKYSPYTQEERTELSGYLVSADTLNAHVDTMLAATNKADDAYLAMIEKAKMMYKGVNEVANVDYTEYLLAINGKNKVENVAVYYGYAGVGENQTPAGVGNTYDTTSADLGGRAGFSTAEKYEADAEGSYRISSYNASSTNKPLNYRFKFDHVAIAEAKAAGMTKLTFYVKASTGVAGFELRFALIKSMTGAMNDGNRIGGLVSVKITGDWVKVELYISGDTIPEGFEIGGAYSSTASEFKTLQKTTLYMSNMVFETVTAAQLNAYVNTMLSAEDKTGETYLAMAENAKMMYKGVNDVENVNYTEYLLAINGKDKEENVAVYYGYAGVGENQTPAGIGNTYNTASADLTGRVGFSADEKYEESSEGSYRISSYNASNMNKALNYRLKFDRVAIAEAKAAGMTKITFYVKASTEVSGFELRFALIKSMTGAMNDSNRIGGLVSVKITGDWVKVELNISGDTIPEGFEIGGAYSSTASEFKTLQMTTLYMSNMIFE